MKQFNLYFFIFILNLVLKICGGQTFTNKDSEKTQRPGFDLIALILNSNKTSSSQQVEVDGDKQEKQTLSQSRNVSYQIPIATRFTNIYSRHIGFDKFASSLNDSHNPTTDFINTRYGIDNFKNLKPKVLALFPKPPDCGPVTVGEKIHGGVEAELGQFPWLANLEYRNEEGYLEIGCSGNILNHRYVVTAAHCVKGLIEELLGHLESLRVGDHNTALDKDCDDTGCNDPYERFTIVERFVHEQYRETKKRRLFNDIALLKTDRNITYSFSVAPICLPAVMGSMPPLTTGATLTVGGWGNNGTSVYTDEKRIVDVPYVENLQCAFRLQDSQICAGGETGKDSCTGDSGGSLARRNATAWVLEGIVSFGRECGTSKHAIYTRVRDFIPWILEKVVEP
ncbi:serine protease 7-like isoform X2 [Haematobia irritans]|uniref:serine protease 7-like isoform X2 n=1 Tax=Haematobia irritans TaxID=7368 RepID=UPI003F4FBC04